MDNRREILQDSIVLGVYRPDGISDEEERRLDAAVTAAIPEVREFYRRLLVERGYPYVTVEWEDEGRVGVDPDPDEPDADEPDPEDN